MYFKPFVVVLIALAALYAKTRFGCITIPEGMHQMKPALKENRMKFVRKTGEIVRRDIVIYKVASMPDELLFSRVIAIAGDTISISKGAVFLNGKRLVEPYCTNVLEGGNFEEILIPLNGLFVLNDARGRGSALKDSRHLGPLSIHAVEGVIRE
jgi:signal peptidase I